jgi:hypothetical protein
MDACQASRNDQSGAELRIGLVRENARYNSGHSDDRGLTAGASRQPTA